MNSTAQIEMPRTTFLCDLQNDTQLSGCVWGCSWLCVNQGRLRAQGVVQKTFWSSWRAWIFQKREIQTGSSLELECRNRWHLCKTELRHWSAVTVWEAMESTPDPATDGNLLPCFFFLNMKE